MFAHTQPVSESCHVQSDFWAEQAAACPPIPSADMQAPSPDSVLTDASDSLTPSGTESYIHPHPDLEYSLSCSYPIDEHTVPYTSMLNFIPSYVESTTMDLSAEITEPSSGDLERVDYTHYWSTYLSAHDQEELGTSDEGACYPYPSIGSNTLRAQYAEELSPLATRVPTLDTQLEDPCATDSTIHTSPPSNTLPSYPSFHSSFDYSSNEPMLEGWSDWNLNPAYSEVAGMNQLVQNNMTLEDCQPTFLSYPTTFYMKGGVSLTIETTLKVSPAAGCRCGGNYLPAMNVDSESDRRQKSLEYC
ncbi:hypothetical protein BDN71DRAFT_1514185 [Pleurotus eryngii]|uniref:Uncharacterized protein n=1 Tax=Pleurotus eryngii TaxID=5323 RepID=A0A9P6D920_PLEER|nr:hypothetical protein BDN71DRAFT_1514185 [Pleurotus eryngii]